MANKSDSNPIQIDTASAACGWTGNKSVVLAQWVDDNADIADNGNLIFTVNGVTMEATVQRGATPDGAGAVLWQIGPFPIPIVWRDFTLTTMSAGHFYIWLS